MMPLSKESQSKFKSVKNIFFSPEIAKFIYCFDIFFFFENDTFENVKIKRGKFRYFACFFPSENQVVP